MFYTDEMSGFFLMNKETKEYVALDYNSGGYPWVQERFQNAHWFKSVEDAMEYRHTFRNYDMYGVKNWIVVRAKIQLTEVV